MYLYVYVYVYIAIIKIIKIDKDKLSICIEMKTWQHRELCIFLSELFISILFVCFVVVFTHPEVLLDCSWLCTQELFLEYSGESMGCQGLSLDQPHAMQILYSLCTCSVPN